MSARVAAVLSVSTLHGARELCRRGGSRYGISGSLQRLNAAVICRVFIALFAALFWFCPADATEAQSTGSTQGLPRTFFGLHIFYPERLEQWPPIGFGSWRLWDTRGITWADLNPAPDAWNLGLLDRVVNMGEAAGVEMLMTLGQTPAWASSRPLEPSPHGPGAAAPPADHEVWARYVEKIVTRYRGRIRAYEIWNEPRLSEVDKWRKTQYFFGTAKDLVALSKIAYATIKRVDPDAIVLSPAFDGEAPGEKRLAAFLAAGGGCCFDVLSFHLYPHTTTAPEGLAARTIRLREQLKRAGIDRPIWNTEFGFLHQESGIDVRPLYADGFLSVVLPPPVATAYLARSFVLGASVGLERFFWFAWDPHSMGLITAPPKRRPSGTAMAYREVANWLVGGRVSACSSEGATWKCSYQGPVSCTGTFYWTTDGVGEITVPPGLTRVRRLNGTDAGLKEGARLSVGIEPVLVHAGSPPPNGCGAQ